MRRFLLLPVMLIALAVAGCAGTQSILSGGTSLTATVQNPIGLNQQYEIEAAVASVRLAGRTFMRQRQCHRSEVASITNICVRNAAKVQVQNASRQLTGVLIPYRNFVRNNQTVSAISAALAVRTAIADYQNILAANGVH